MPEESNLVLRGDQIVGQITSVGRSAVLAKIVGLAFTSADEAGVGRPIHIKLTDGRMVVGTVAALPFYDPENKRQEL